MWFHEERNFTRIPSLLGEGWSPETNNFDGAIYNSQPMWQKHFLYQPSKTHSTSHFSRFKEPRKVIASLSPYFYEQEKKEILNKIINGEETNIKVDIDLQANQLIYFFKELFDENQTTNFYFKKEIIKLDY